MFRVLSVPFLLITALAAAPVDPDAYFAIQIVDDETGRGVPLVELTTVHGVTFVTDSAGRVAFFEPGLMNRKVYFTVRSHGYEFPKDGFGAPSLIVETTPGASVRAEIRRVNLAERLYRLSGAGIYRDTILLGLPAPMTEPLLNASVTGQDSVFGTIYRDRIYWFWGDTGRVRHALGNFHASGATSPLPGESGTKPYQAINYTYFTDDEGFAKGMAPMPGKGPTWISGLTVLPDESGRQRMVAGYAKIQNYLETHARGIAIFEDDSELFVHAREIPLDAPLYPIGHAVQFEDGHGERVYFSQSLPLVRTSSATVEGYLDFETYETFTPLREGTRFEDRQLERNGDGAIVYDWKPNTDLVGPQEQAKLIEDGFLAAEEALFAPRDLLTGDPILLHGGAVEWNPYRERWVLIASQLYGTSVLGELWFAEADSPLGPWVYARKIVTHDSYTFYNPKHHPFLDEEDGRLIYFEGTYTELFSGANHRTPRYDYNQILYRLDLSRPELQLPVAIYREARGGRCHVSARTGATGVSRPVFWAMESAPTNSSADAAVAVVCAGADPGSSSHQCQFTAASGANQENPVLFYGIPADAAEPPPGSMPLTNTAGETVCLVWSHPLTKGPLLPVIRP